MARRRMIDPNFWSSEDVSKLSIFERLLLIGLFSNADDEGRGRSQTTFLRSIIFPYDDIKLSDIENALQKLTEFVEIRLYSVEGSRYYEFKNWTKWQRVDKPQKSLIPCATTEESFQEEDKNDSENHSKNESRLKEDNIREVKIPYDDIFNLFSELGFNFPKIKAKTENRKTNIKAIWKENNNIEYFADLFQKSNESDFLTGQVKEWSADFDWILKNHVKISEGSYGNKSGGNKNNTIKVADF